jgi:DNA-binding CsgD family transcriptional regulator
MIMAVLLFAIILNIGYFVKEISSDTYLLLIALLMLGGNIIPIYYYRWFLVRYFEDHGTISPESDLKIDIEKLYQEYNVTNREREIISLICDGKTNQEVADILFISLQTVKDHIYRIYKKLGVKNRVQLTNLFKGE